MTTKNKSYPLILDGTFFTVVETNAEGSVTAKCCTCSNHFKGNLKSTSNFLTHLQLKHPEKELEYKEYKKNGVPSKKQKTLHFPVVSRVSGLATKQKRVNALIMDVMVHNMLALRFVECTYFKKLIADLDPSVKIFTRKTFKNLIREKFLLMQKEIIEILSAVQWVSITADIWSSRHRSFMGVTCHWITEDFARKSVVLTLKRFKGRHTAERIKDLLEELFKEFKISDKITSVTTDNGSNFVKAFKEYGLRPVDLDENSENVEEDVCAALDDSNVENNDWTDEDESEFDTDDNDLTVAAKVDLTSLLDDDISMTLPTHSRCASHTLSLVATTDLESELEKRVPRQDKNKTSCKKIMRATLAKCSAYWNKSSRSVIVGEQIKDVISNSVVTPVQTRWNSTFDSIGQLIKHFEKLDSLFDIANVERLKSHEKEFLKGYHEGLAPVAWALDKLQAEENMYFGYLAPVIHKTNSKLDLLANSESQYTSYVATSLLVGLRNRFGHILNFENYNSAEQLSAVCLPHAKLRWVQEENRSLLKAAFITAIKKVECDSPPLFVSKIQIDDDLFDNDLEAPSLQEDAELECIRYLKDPDTDLKSLVGYPKIKSLFFRLNTTLPSSAPAERLFSYGKMVLRPQRAKMSDKLFEFFVLLKLNGEK